MSAAWLFSLGVQRALTTDVPDRAAGASSGEAPGRRSRWFGRSTLPSARTSTPSS